MPIGVQRRLGEYRSRLIDLSRRNNLLYFVSRKRRSLSIQFPDPETIFNRTVLRRAKWEFLLPPAEYVPANLTAQWQIDESLRYLSPNKKQLACPGCSDVELESTLKNLFRRSSTDYRERGIRILYLAFGFLLWREAASGEAMRSPLVLVPVELSRKSPRDPFTINIPLVEDEVIVNPALSVKLQSDFGIDFPAFPDELGSHTLDDYLKTLASQLSKYGWSVDYSVELGLFSFQKLVMYRDLGLNAETIAAHPVVRALSGEKGINLVLDNLAQERDIDEIEARRGSYQVLDADSSQRVAIDYALSQQSLVMWGPPGTGKSQTIANIIAEAIARGKSVLFVSDKMAALEVVYNRLCDVGLQSFCLEIHSDKANKLKVVAELGRSLDDHALARRVPTVEELERSTDVRERLNKYVASLHRVRVPIGKSAFEILADLSLLEHVMLVPLELRDPRAFDAATMRTLEDRISRLQNSWLAVEDKTFPWTGHKANTYTLETRAGLISLLERLQESLSCLANCVSEYSQVTGLQPPGSFKHVAHLLAIGEKAAEGPRPEPNWVTASDMSILIDEAKGLKAFQTWQKATRNRLVYQYGEPFLDTHIRQLSALERSLTRLSDLTGDKEWREDQLLTKLHELTAFVERTVADLELWEGQAARLTDTLGFTPSDYALATVKRLASIASLCSSEKAPRKDWFGPGAISEVEQALNQIRTRAQERETLRNRLKHTYSDLLYSLDIEGLFKRFTTEHNHPLRWLSSAYRTDRSIIEAVTLTGRIPQNVVRDLLEARQIKEIEADFTRMAQARKALLGDYYQGMDTDCHALEEAYNTARMILTHCGADGPSDRLIDLATRRDEKSSQTRSAGIELLNAIEAWQRSGDAFTNLLPSALSRTGEAWQIHTASLKSAQEWAKETLDAANVLCDLTDTLLTNTTSRPQTFRELLSDGEEVILLQNRLADFRSRASVLREMFGSRFSDLETDWEETLAVLRWTANLRELAGSDNLSERFAHVVSEGDRESLSPKELSLRFTEARTVLSDFCSQFEDGKGILERPPEELPIADLRQKIDATLARIEDLQTWIDFKDAKTWFYINDYRQFFDVIAELGLRKEALPDILRKAVYSEIITALLRDEPSLGEFRRENHENLVDEFRRTDKQLLKRNPGRVIRSANERKPGTSVAQAINDQVSILRKEAAKKRRIRPIRSLLADIPELLARLKPCLMMSPLSVSQFLEPRLMQFDLLLFDEASQLLPEDAIGAIYRARTIVVAGDDRQLPPTTFFQKSLIDEVDWENIENEDIAISDSILEECLGIGLPVKMLKWHYRSRHEELISFSNKELYSGQLVTFPSAFSSHKDLGVKFVFVEDGVYDRGGRRDNPQEAKAVADLVFEHFRTFPKKTLGVVTFGVPQMEAIEEEVERRRRTDDSFEDLFREDRLRGFFVKNLENVQGDERDVIIFDVGYGRDPDGKMTLNFGPLNKPGGERRLNVAITRAREKIVLVSSIRAVDLSGAASATAGVKLLRDYLDYAENGARPKPSAPLGFDEPETSLHRSIAEEITQLGYQFVSPLGTSLNRIDFAVLNPDSPDAFLMGIDCDGPSYRDMFSARDRDRLRQEMLEEMGWKAYRIWSPSWVAKREAESSMLYKELTDARERSRSRKGRTSIKTTSSAKTTKAHGGTHKTENPSQNSGPPLE